MFFFIIIVINLFNTTAVNAIMFTLPMYCELIISQDLYLLDSFFPFPVC